LLLALVDDHRERHESAHEHILRAIAAAPEDARHRVVLGCILARWDRIEDGITAARQGLLLQPGSGFALGTLASLYRINDEPELAARYATQALEAEPDAAHHHLEEGLGLLERRAPGPARLRFLEALRLDPVRGDTFDAIAHETVRTHWAFKHGIFPPKQPDLAIAALLVPPTWYVLSLAWRPLIAVAWLSSALLVAGYAYLGVFVLCRRAVVARLRRGRL
jgi:Flp pilus assembly protein TadD